MGDRPRPAWAKREFAKSQANRTICEPRGRHRLVGPAEEFKLGGRPKMMRLCADCQIWQVA